MQKELASLIASSWNPLMERLKAIGSLRDLANALQTKPLQEG